MRYDFGISMDAQLEDFFRQAPNLFLQAAAKALYEEAEMIMTDSKENYVPVQTGNLKSSGHVQLPVISGSQVSVTMGYGGPAAKYALAVHEGLDMQPRVIKVRDKKVLAVPIEKFFGTAYPYGSKRLPMISKDGRFVILGKRVNHPGGRIRASKYLETPLNQAAPNLSGNIAQRIKDDLGL